MFPNIEAERARAGLSKLKLAKLLGISYGTLNSWLSGKTQIPCSRIIEMAKLFNVSTDYLLNVCPSPLVNTERRKDNETDQ